MTATPLILNLFGQPTSGRYQLAARLVLALEAQGRSVRLAVPELACLDPALAPTPQQQLDLARTLMDPMDQALAAQVIVVPEPLLAPYARAPSQFRPTDSDVLTELLAMHRHGPSLNVVVTRAPGQDDRNPATGQLSEVARDRLALDAQMVLTLKEVGVVTHTHLHQDGMSLEPLLAELSLTSDWARAA